MQLTNNQLIKKPLLATALLGLGLAFSVAHSKDEKAEAPKKEDKVPSKS